MTFFLHHRQLGTLTTIKCGTDAWARRLGAKLPESVEYVVEIRYEGMSEYQGFRGVREPYEFVQPDAKAFEK